MDFGNLIAGSFSFAKELKKISKPAIPLRLSTGLPRARALAREWLPDALLAGVMLTSPAKPDSIGYFFVSPTTKSADGCVVYVAAMQSTTLAIHYTASAQGCPRPIRNPSCSLPQVIAFSPEKKLSMLYYTSQGWIGNSPSDMVAIGRPPCR